MCHILLNFWRNTLLKVTIIQWYSVVVHYGMKYTQEDICNIHVKKDWKKQSHSWLNQGHIIKVEGQIQ